MVNKVCPAAILAARKSGGDLIKILMRRASEALARGDLLVNQLVC
jgi:hypothetical protein